MMLSLDESARAWFLKTVEVDHIVWVPVLKGLGRVIALSGSVLVDMLDGPYYNQRFTLDWSEIARPN